MPEKWEPMTKIERNKTNCSGFLPFPVQGRMKEREEYLIKYIYCT
jgi:hypothetical protein